MVLGSVEAKQIWWKNAILENARKIPKHPFVTTSGQKSFKMLRPFFRFPPSQFPQFPPVGFCTEGMILRSMILPFPLIGED
jgi:hypothetical protein